MCNRPVLKFTPLECCNYGRLARDLGCIWRLVEMALTSLYSYSTLINDVFKVFNCTVTQNLNTMTCVHFHPDTLNETDHWLFVLQFICCIMAPLYVGRYQLCFSRKFIELLYMHLNKYWINVSNLFWGLLQYLSTLNGWSRSSLSTTTDRLASLLTHYYTSYKYLVHAKGPKRVPC